MGRVYWYEKDLHGNVTAVYNVRGLKHTTYRYDAWGKKSAMYGVIEVYSDGTIYNGNHRVYIARKLGIAVDTIVSYLR